MTGSGRLDVAVRRLERAASHARTAARPSRRRGGRPGRRASSTWTAPGSRPTSTPPARGSASWPRPPPRRSRRWTRPSPTSSLPWAPGRRAARGRVAPWPRSSFRSTTSPTASAARTARSRTSAPSPPSSTPRSPRSRTRPARSGETRLMLLGGLMLADELEVSCSVAHSPRRRPAPPTWRRRPMAAEATSGRRPRGRRAKAGSHGRALTPSYGVWVCERATSCLTRDKNNRGAWHARQDERASALVRSPRLRAAAGAGGAAGPGPLPRHLQGQLVETNTTLSSGSCTRGRPRDGRTTSRPPAFTDADLTYFATPEHPKDGGLLSLILPGQRSRPPSRSCCSATSMSSRPSARTGPATPSS